MVSFLPLIPETACLRTYFHNKITHGVDDEYHFDQSRVEEASTKIIN